MTNFSEEQKSGCGSGKMAQQVRFLPYKHENGSSSLQRPHECQVSIEGHLLSLCSGGRDMKSMEQAVS